MRRSSETQLDTGETWEGHQDREETGDRGREGRQARRTGQKTNVTEKGKQTQGFNDEHKWAGTAMSKPL